MPYSREIIAQRSREKETDGFKMFMRLAKQIKKLEWGKWSIVPDSSDPLRKFTLVKDIGLVDLHLTVYQREFYHRGVYDDNRWDWQPMLGITGLSQTTRQDDGLIRTGVRLGPRAAKKIVQYVNEVVVPNFYKAVQEESVRAQKVLTLQEQWRKDVAKVNGLTAHNDPNDWSHVPGGQLAGCPLVLKLHEGSVHVEARISYEELAKMAASCGWGK